MLLNRLKLLHLIKVLENLTYRYKEKSNIIA